MPPCSSNWPSSAGLVGIVTARGSPHEAGPPAPRRLLILALAGLIFLGLRGGTAPDPSLAHADTLLTDSVPMWRKQRVADSLRLRDSLRVADSLHAVADKAGRAKRTARRQADSLRTLTDSLRLQLAAQEGTPLAHDATVGDSLEYYRTLADRQSRVIGTLGAENQWLRAAADRGDDESGGLRQELVRVRHIVDVQRGIIEEGQRREDLLAGALDSLGRRTGQTARC
jgi:hypothetical protein